eukprot:jgi/Ulvmu1/3277/UM151_0025.1
MRLIASFSPATFRTRRWAALCQCHQMYSACKAYSFGILAKCYRMQGSSLPHFQLRTYQPRRLRASAQSLAVSPDAAVAQSFLEPEAQDVERFSTIKRWIVFSDLHVHQRFDPYWRDSLHSVSAIAAEHNAGCIFLGDFWDARENVPHRLLRQVEESLRDWSHPTISITGNHDQASLSGVEHNMSILETICPQWKVLSCPTLLNNAAWIPYRADQKELRQLLSAARERSQPLSAMFVHADITGARFNTSQQAHAGVGQDAFPQDIPTYSGHYHLPQTVPNTSITYIGSPFQLNFGEAGETKRVLLLDERFQLLRSIPLCCGPEHHVLPWASRDEWLLGDLRRFNSRSIVRVTAPSSEQAAVAKARETLAATGARVSVILEPPPLARLHPQPPAGDAHACGTVSAEGTAAALAAGEVLATAPQSGPVDMLHAFLDYRERQTAAGLAETGEQSAAGQKSLQRKVRTEALRVMHACQDGAAPAARCAAHAAPVRLDDVTVEGFRCFGAQPAAFSFAAPGVVALSGRNDMDPGSLSNGAGKTAIASAAVWALAGALSGWLADSGRLGLTRTDVINHSPAVKRARVRLRGAVGGRPFLIERTATKHKGTLVFEVDGEDCTGATLKATQAEIDALLSPHLPTVVFHSQATVMGLLEAPDAKFKEALAPLVDLSLWQACEDHVKALAKGSKSDCDRTETSLRHCRGAATAAAAESISAAAARAAAAAAASSAANAAEAAAQAAGAAAQPLLRLQRQVAAAAAVVGARLRSVDAERRELWAAVSAEAAARDAAAAETAAETDAEAQEIERLRREHSMRAGQVHEQRTIATAAAAALSAARRDAADAQRALDGARESAADFHAQHKHGSHREDAGPHCELCGQELRGEASAVTLANLTVAVEVAEGACTTAQRVAEEAERQSAAAARKQDELLAAAQEAREREEAVTARRRERQAKQAPAAQATCTAREEAAQAQRARHRERSAALDGDGAHLNSASASLTRCAAVLDAAAARVKPASHDFRLPARGASAAIADRATHADSPPAQLDGAAEGPAAEGGSMAWGWGPAAHSMGDHDSGGEHTCSHERGLHPREAGAGGEPVVGQHQTQNNSWEALEEMWEARAAAEMHEEAEQLAREADDVVAGMHATQDALVTTARELSTATAMLEMHESESRRAAAKQAACEEQAEAAQTAASAARSRALLHVELLRVFGHGGVQHYEVDGVVHDLSARTAPLLRMLAPQFQLHLRTQRPETSSKQTDSIEKRLTRISEGQVTQEGLYLGSLSTGERRRVALALTLGYVELLRARGVAAADTLLLDEVHANLDGEGVRRVVDVLRTLSQRCVVLVGQAGTEIAETADRHEVVVKRRDGVVELETQF